MKYSIGVSTQVNIWILLRFNFFPLLQGLFVLHRSIRITYCLLPESGFSLFPPLNKLVTFRYLIAMGTAVDNEMKAAHSTVSLDSDLCLWIFNLFSFSSLSPQAILQCYGALVTPTSSSLSQISSSRTWRFLAFVLGWCVYPLT